MRVGSANRILLKKLSFTEMRLSRSFALRWCEPATKSVGASPAMSRRFLVAGGRSRLEAAVSREVPGIFGTKTAIIIGAAGPGNCDLEESTPAAAQRHHENCTNCNAVRIG